MQMLLTILAWKIDKAVGAIYPEKAQETKPPEGEQLFLTLTGANGCQLWAFS